MDEIVPKEQEWDGWPEDSELQKLSKQANGLFHYAATALNWIEGEIKELKTDCKESVLQDVTKEGMGELNDLYKLILSSFDNPKRSKDKRAKQMQGFRQVMGTILALQKQLASRQIIALCDNIPGFGVRNVLERFQSVLFPSMTRPFEEAKSQMHTTFRDYMLESAEPRFQILAGDAHSMAMECCLENIIKAGSSQSDLDCDYSVQYWHLHLQKAVEKQASWDHNKMQILFEQMVEAGITTVWGTKVKESTFYHVANAGWRLLE
ncbi:hypothetical protein B0H13DRAFT_1473714, partial [Mycena leptocephala]